PNERDGPGSRRRTQTILLRTLARHAQRRPGDDVQTLERDRLTAHFTDAVLLRFTIQTTQRGIDPVDQTAFLARQEEPLLLLLGVRALIRRMKRVRRQISVVLLGRYPGLLVELRQRLARTFTLPDETTLEMRTLLLIHERTPPRMTSDPDERNPAATPDISTAGVTGGRDSALRSGSGILQAPAPEGEQQMFPENEPATGKCTCAYSNSAGRATTVGYISPGRTGEGGCLSRGAPGGPARKER